MFEWVKERVLKLMRVPHEPEPPLGAPGSIRVFRAGINQYYLRLARWAVAQSAAVVGIGFSVIFLGAMEAGVEIAQRAVSLQPLTASTPAPSPAAPSASPVPRSRAERRRAQEQVMYAVIARTPPFVLPLIKLFEIVGVAFLGFQMLVTYSIVRLEFEQHWYIVTDRSLRIRTGILRLQESTMSFANIQQVEIRQGPLQRALGMADVCVRSAGGSEPEHGQKGRGPEQSLHVGTFQNVTNAVEIRDLILDRLRKFREAGLGDPDDRHGAPAPSSTPIHADSALDAARELLEEARALRRALIG